MGLVAVAKCMATSAIFSISTKLYQFQLSQEFYSVNVDQLKDYKSFADFATRDEILENCVSDQQQTSHLIPTHIFSPFQIQWETYGKWPQNEKFKIMSTICRGKMSLLP